MNQQGGDSGHGCGCDLVHTGSGCDHKNEPVEHGGQEPDDNEHEGHGSEHPQATSADEGTITVALPDQPSRNQDHPSVPGHDGEEQIPERQEAAPTTAIAPKPVSNAHTNFVKVSTRNAKCDQCEKRNTSVMQKCCRCGMTTCSTCHARGKYDSRHQLADLELDWVDEPRGRRRRKFNGEGGETGGDAGGSGSERGKQRGGGLRARGLVREAAFYGDGPGPATAMGAAVDTAMETGTTVEARNTDRARGGALRALGLVRDTALYGDGPDTAMETDASVEAKNTDCTRGGTLRALGLVRDTSLYGGPSTAVGAAVEAGNFDCAAAGDTGESGQAGNPSGLGASAGTAQNTQAPGQIVHVAGRQPAIRLPNGRRALPAIRLRLAPAPAAPAPRFSRGGLARNSHDAVRGPNDQRVKRAGPSGPPNSRPLSAVGFSRPSVKAIAGLSSVPSRPPAIAASGPSYATPAPPAASPSGPSSTPLGGPAPVVDGLLPSAATYRSISQYWSAIGQPEIAQRYADMEQQRRQLGRHRCLPQSEDSGRMPHPQLMQYRPDMARESNERTTITEQSIRSYLINSDGTISAVPSSAEPIMCAPVADMGYDPGDLMDVDGEQEPVPQRASGSDQAAPNSQYTARMRHLLDEYRNLNRSGGRGQEPLIHRSASAGPGPVFGLPAPPSQNMEQLESRQRALQWSLIDQLETDWNENPVIQNVRRTEGPLAALDLLEASVGLEVIRQGLPRDSFLTFWIVGMRSALRHRALGTKLHLPR
ncbi:Uu.00g019590.m01.CDS01 [Anthostomella pinea]|uniref:Uu.00g019590.m01.CDS01 n=1 Tax=Anthostomella pinea TaxID=933095 RepID=A0AAI8VZV6_9PEZI|nr:Uu.00g019590.m01.CDS01 [Anthostomella pinea]